MQQYFIIKNPEIRRNAQEAIGKIPLGFEVIFRPKRKTSAQERYFHTLVDLIIGQTGQGDIKDQIKMKVLGYDDCIDLDGNPYRKVKSSSDINDKQYGELIEAAKIILDNMEVTYPVPSYYGYSF